MRGVNGAHSGTATEISWLSYKACNKTAGAPCRLVCVLGAEVLPFYKTTVSARMKGINTLHLLE